jgi:hypothetical protein
MGTNFYWLGHQHEYGIQHHIGKRSAAGLYCFDCGTTLCHNGIQGIHTGLGDWLATCPSCGKARKDESITESAPGVELGCAKRNGKPSGLRSASSFTWTLLKHKREIEALRDYSSKPVIVDEYGREYTAREFLDELQWCPVEFQSPHEFS